MGDCSPACIKIILNGGFVAATSKLLISYLGAEAKEAALRLSETATALVAAYEHAIKYGVLVRVGGAIKFDGCDQARTITAWLIANVAPTNAADVMNGWADEMLDDIEALVGA